MSEKVGVSETGMSYAKSTLVRVISRGQEG